MPLKIGRYRNPTENEIKQKPSKYYIWLVVSTHLKNITVVKLEIFPK